MNAPRLLRLAVVATAILASLLLSSGVTAASSGITPAEIVVKTILAGLEWPVAIDFAPDGRLFYGELLTGRVRIVSGGTLLDTPFYAFDDAVFFGERGLLGLALHPAFETDPWVYVYYTYHDEADGRDYNRIARVWTNGDVGEFHEVVLDRIPGALNHNGGVIAFGPDGMLYALVGDTEDPASAQNLTSQSGKALRMTPEGAVPSDNPFSGIGDADPYVLTFGHRNMFGLAHHPATGQLFVTENGPFCNDEVNLLVPGANYGWGPNWTCATPPEPPANTNQDGPEPTFPVFLYNNVVAPTNAIVYSGGEFPDWEGDLIAGEWNSGSLRRLKLDPPGYDAVTGEEVVHTAPSGILDVEVGLDEAIWFTTFDSIFRLATSVPPMAAFTAASAFPFANVEVVTFDASASVDTDGTIVSYDWDFGDGRSGRGVTASHIYGAEGTYVVTLTVADSDGLARTAMSTVTVREPQPPLASFMGSDPAVVFRETMSFDAYGPNNPDGRVVITVSDRKAEETFQRTVTVEPTMGSASRLETGRSWLLWAKLFAAGSVGALLWPATGWAERKGSNPSIH